MSQSSFGVPASGSQPAQNAKAQQPSPQANEFRLFIIAGELSGDALGSKLMAAITRRTTTPVRYLGVGGQEMRREGLNSQFPIEEVAVMGPLSILPRLPRIARRVFATAASAVAAEPDAVVIIDAPEFTHPIAKRIRARNPDIPIIDYVSPSVWAWRSGRARKMCRYVDHVLALLPFEPEAHERLGGPACSYVGHPLIERYDWIASRDPVALFHRLGMEPNRAILLVLPGSRSSEVERLMPAFSEAVALIAQAMGTLEVIIPVVATVRGMVEAGVARWPARVHFVDNDDDKFAAFRLAHAALTASGTVTLELALAGTPTVVAYRVDRLVAPLLRRSLKIPSVVLANLVAGHNIYPEFLQEDCTGYKLASALAPLLGDTPERQAQLAALAHVPERLRIESAPSDLAAEIVLHYAENGRDIETSKSGPVL